MTFDLWATQMSAYFESTKTLIGEAAMADDMKSVAGLAEAYTRYTAHRTETNNKLDGVEESW